MQVQQHRNARTTHAHTLSHTLAATCALVQHQPVLPLKQALFQGACANGSHRRQLLAALPLRRNPCSCTTTRLPAHPCAPRPLCPASAARVVCVCVCVLRPPPHQGSCAKRPPASARGVLWPARPQVLVSNVKQGALHPCLAAAPPRTPARISPDGSRAPQPIAPCSNQRSSRPQQATVRARVLNTLAAPLSLSCFILLLLPCRALATACATSRQVRRITHQDKRTPTRKRRANTHGCAAPPRRACAVVRISISREQRTTNHTSHIMCNHAPTHARSAVSAQSGT